MAATKKRPAVKAATNEAEGKQKVTVWLSPDTLEQLNEVKRCAGFGTRAEIMREALTLGLEQLLARYER
jgi:metal-responsive CopG/Arc/MetJ family transcriptional regulator